MVRTRVLSGQRWSGFLRPGVLRVSTRVELRTGLLRGQKESELEFSEVKDGQD